MKPPKPKKCPLALPEAEGCRIEGTEVRPAKVQSPVVVVIRTDRKSWFALAITGFGAVLLRYLRVIRERTRRLSIW